MFSSQGCSISGFRLGYHVDSVAAPDQGPWLTAAIWVCSAIAAAVTALWRLISSRASKKELADAISAVVDQTAALRERTDEQYQVGMEHRSRLETKFDNLSRDVGATMVGLSGIQGRLNERTDLLKRIADKLGD